MKLGRNDLCPCGSGKKFKKCCWDDYHRIVIIGSKIRKLPSESLIELMDDLETDKYGKGYVNERSKNIS